jgi:hypothetical protein
MVKSPFRGGEKLNKIEVAVRIYGVANPSEGFE